MKLKLNAHKPINSVFIMTNRQLIILFDILKLESRQNETLHWRKKTQHIEKKWSRVHLKSLVTRLMTQFRKVLLEIDALYDDWGSSKTKDDQELSDKLTDHSKRWNNPKESHLAIVEKSYRGHGIVITLGQ